MGYDGKYYGIGMTKEQKLADLRERLANFTILKDTLKGRTYYAVVRDEKRDAVFCVVATTRMSNGYFMVKMMGDDENPYYYDCPKSYIALCTEPYNEHAKIWREKCLEKSSKGVVPMAERKYKCTWTVPALKEDGTPKMGENGHAVFVQEEQVLTLSEIKEYEGVYGDRLTRSQIVRRQSVGGAFVLNGTVYTRVY